MRAALSSDAESEAFRQEERKLVDACLRGDAAARTRLFKEHVRTVERAVGRVVGATPDLEDLVQQTFIEALRSLPSFRGISRLDTWLTRLAIHVTCRHLRARRVRRHVSLEAVPESVLPSEDGAGRDQLLDERKVAARLHGLLDQISAKKRVAFVLFAVEGRPVAEVAALMGATETATRSRVFFARRELRALVAADPLLADHAEALLAGEGRKS